MPSGDFYLFNAVPVGGRRGRVLYCKTEERQRSRDYIFMQSRWVRGG